MKASTCSVMSGSFHVAIDGLSHPADIVSTRYCSLGARRSAAADDRRTRRVDRSPLRCVARALEARERLAVRWDHPVMSRWARARWFLARRVCPWPIAALAGDGAV